MKYKIFLLFFLEKEIFERNFLSQEALNKKKADVPDSEKSLSSVVQEIKMRNFDIQILTKKKIWIILLIFSAFCLLLTYLSQFCKEALFQYYIINNYLFFFALLLILLFYFNLSYFFINF